MMARLSRLVAGTEKEEERMEVEGVGLVGRKVLDRRELRLPGFVGAYGDSSARWGNRKLGGG